MRGRYAQISIFGCYFTLPTSAGIFLPISIVFMTQYTPSGLTRLCWWLATAEEALIKDCIIDRNRYAIIGASVLGTWVFATLAWAYFFSTVTGTIPAVLMGILMGLIILGIDRALIKSIRKTNRNQILALIFRGLLAVMIGLFMAQPALLFLFEKEVRVQASLDNEARKQQKRAEQEKVYAPRKIALLNQQKRLQNELDIRYTAMNQARIDFIAETDGTGGSKKIGLKDIAQAKQREYERLLGEYNDRTQQNNPSITVINEELKMIEEQINKEQAAFNTLLNEGFVTRIEALNHLVEKNTAVAFRYYLLVGILLLIELMPLLSKLMMPYGTYEEKAMFVEEEEIRAIRP